MHPIAALAGAGVALALSAISAFARHPWVTWIGLAIILYVAGDMIWRGALEVACTSVPQQVCQQGLIPAAGELLGG